MPVLARDGAVARPLVNQITILLLPRHFELNNSAGESNEPENGTMSRRLVAVGLQSYSLEASTTI